MANVKQQIRKVSDESYSLKPVSGSTSRSTIEGHTYANRDMALIILRRLRNILDTLQYSEDSEGMKDADPQGLLGHLEKTGDYLNESIRLLNNIEGVIGMEPQLVKG